VCEGDLALAHLGREGALGDRVSTTVDGTEIRGGAVERAPRRRDWGVWAGEMVSLRARVGAHVHVSAHGRVAANKCTRRLSTTEERWLDAV
jgi:hypothetical protein